MGACGAADPAQGRGANWWEACGTPEGPAVTNRREEEGARGAGVAPDPWPRTTPSARPAGQGRRPG